MIVLTPSGGKLYPIIKSIITTEPLRQINETRTTAIFPSTQSQLYGNGYYLNNSFKIAYRSSNILRTYPLRNLSNSDILSGVLGRDYFYFALQDVEGKCDILLFYCCCWCCCSWCCCCYIVAIYSIVLLCYFIITIIVITIIVMFVILIFDSLLFVL